ncbi:RluA family pseudouridine synthase [bacterium]|nr:RluA family pseudouridine synthase [candidate division CSSED10-310 bacterium]
MTVKKRSITCSKTCNNERLDMFLARKIEFLSRSKIRKLIVDGGVYVNDRRVRINSRTLRPGDRILVYIPDEIRENRQLSLPIDVLFEDEYLMVVNKPGGISTSPSRYNVTDCIIGRLHEQLGEKKYLEPVHRLDKLTSGVLILSKKLSMTKSMFDLFKRRRVGKKYIAVVEGKMNPESGEISSYLNRSKRNPAKMIQDNQSGKLATTRYRTCHYDSEQNLSYLIIHIPTGRTHQIRVHLAGSGHPVAGDSLYGSHISKKTLLLHALSVTFTHPLTKKRIRIDANSPFWFPKLSGEKKINDFS